MGGKRLAAVIFIFACTAVGWFVLAGSLVVRTGASDEKLSREVAQLWGGRHVQMAPTALLRRERTITEMVQQKQPDGTVVARETTRTALEEVPLPLDSSRIRVALSAEHRRKGLLWYDTYEVDFSSTCEVHNPDPAERGLTVRFTFPSSEAIYDGFVLRVGGVEVPFSGDLAQGMTGSATLPPGGRTTIEVAYRSRGLDSWTYAFAPAGVAQVRAFDLRVLTDFEGVDFPAGTISPGGKSRSGRGWDLSWSFQTLVTGQRIGVDLPNRLNPGPVTARITFFAPVGLLFFLTVMVILGLLSGRNLHPMNYFFLAAAFFAFHLLMAYLVDHINIHAAFLISALVSLFLVITYLRLVGGMRLALAQAGVAQLVFLVMFSYAFFFEGYTGLTITAGAIVTLFVLMQITGRVDWARAFERSGEAPA